MMTIVSRTSGERSVVVLRVGTGGEDGQFGLLLSGLSGGSVGGGRRDQGRVDGSGVNHVDVASKSREGGRGAVGGGVGLGALDL